MEIETKYVLTETDFKRISVIFAKRRAENLIKKDSYYSRYSTVKKSIAKKEPLIRIREENGKGFLTVKRKSMKGNFESNQEEETKVDDVSVLKNLFLSTGYSEYFHKEKSAWSLIREVPFKDEDSVYVHMELESVNKKYFYLELEVTGDVPEDKAMQAIVGIANEFGIKEEQRDNRTWPEILGIKV